MVVVVVVVVVIGSHLHSVFANFYILHCLYIFIVGEPMDFKYGLRVDHSNSQPMDNKSSLKGPWSRHSRDPF